MLYCCTTGVCPTRNCPHRTSNLQPPTSNLSVCLSSVEHSQSTTTFLPRTSQLRPLRSSHHARRRTPPHDPLTAQEERATELFHRSLLRSLDVAHQHARGGVQGQQRPTPSAEKRRTSRCPTSRRARNGSSSPSCCSRRGPPPYVPTAPLPLPPRCVALSRGGEETQREDKNTQRRARTAERGWLPPRTYARANDIEHARRRASPPDTPSSPSRPAPTNPQTNNNNKETPAHQQRRRRRRRRPRPRAGASSSRRTTPPAAPRSSTAPPRLRRCPG